MVISDAFRVELTRHVASEVTIEVPYVRCFSGKSMSDSMLNSFAQTSY